MSATPPCIQPSAKPCPICRVSMLGSRTDPTHGEFGRFECLNCGLVIDYSNSGDTLDRQSTNKVWTIMQWRVVASKPNRVWFGGSQGLVTS